MGQERTTKPEPDAQWDSSSQPPVGASGPHANPVAPGEPKGKTPMLPPGAAMLPRKDPDMPATGAADGPHPPHPAEQERRVAQVDWDKWRASDRRKAAFEYPNWRT